MRFNIGTLFALLPILAGTQNARADFLRRGEEADGVTTSDIKACYEHLATRYASWAQRKKEQPKSNGMFGDLKLAVANQEMVPPPPTKRGMILKLHAVGGYPKMLGETFNAEVGMGTPAQLFNLTADTGSMLTWAVQASCKEADCPGVTIKKTYDPKESKTSKEIRADHEAYGDGEMDLTLFSDVVRLDTISINEATIGGAKKTFEKDGKLEHDGLFGLGRKLKADPQPVLDILKLKEPTFNHIVALDLGPQASLEIGGYDFEKYAKMKHYKVDTDEGWLLTRSIITAKGAERLGSMDLLLDTGSSVSMLPEARMDAIMNRPGLKVQKTKEEPIVYSMPCDTKLNVQMVLPDGTLVPVRDEDILMQSNDPKTPGCLSLLVGTTNPFLPAVAGTPILRSIYTVLHKTDDGDWIGLAPLQTGSTKKRKRSAKQRHHSKVGTEV
ncbi:related to secreted aspartic protease 2 [Ustilago trichophora]|uniref:Related to secreted aspartic protease 2 n=1 Tax=Ustilago trichophora TaxID=86804 RepID=A0A5C3E965_9BASI|nr:related to secreted aspartic protease 2 [Ustilago trichophora]